MKGVLKFLVSATVGLAYGLLFAQKSGKKFREQLKKSKTPGKTLLQELKKIDLEARGEVAEWAKNSEDLQKVLESGKKQFDAFVEKVKTLGEDVSEVAEKELEELSRNAKNAAQKLKKEAKRHTVRFKNTLEKKVAKKTGKRTAKRTVKKSSKKVVKKAKTTSPSPRKRTTKTASSSKKK